MEKNSHYLPFTNNRVISLYSTIEIALFGLAFGKLYKDNIILTMQNIFYIVAIFVMLLMSCYLVIQLCNMLRKSKEGSTIQASEYKTILAMIIVICVSFSITQITNGEYSFESIWKGNVIAYICLCCFVFIPFMALIISQHNLNEDISLLNGLDYGTGMAYSFYYGYLRIILPSTGTANKGILEKIENFEDTHDVSVTVKKLFILIPSSSYISPDLKELSYGWLENSQELEVEKRDRAGIKSRSYHNNIYKIYPGGKNPGVKPEYVVVEGATPMLTFFEVQKHFHPESATYKKYREQIIRLFYVKLKELISNDPDCKDLCELIYYNDQDSNGHKVNVAKIILERIATLKDKE